MKNFFDGLYGTMAMAEVFSPEAQVEAMLEFEAALARAQARTGVIPNTAAESIAAQCRVEFFDVPDIFRQTAIAGTPVIPLVRRLTEIVRGEARKYVHWAATSQDVMDTALVLQLRRGLPLLLADLLTLGDRCAGLAKAHRRTLMPGRTLLQQAVPIPFGLKAARWLSMVGRLIFELRGKQDKALRLQFGGAAGTLAALGAKGMAVTDALAQELRLAAPELPWHTERDRLALLISALGVIAGAMTKIAQDIVLLKQIEVGEVTEAGGEDKGTSSAMPQKENALEAILARASARLAIHEVPLVLAAMEQEHERAAGAWQSEGPAIPAAVCYTAGAVAHVKNALLDLEVNGPKMRENLERDGGLLMAEALLIALAERVGKPKARTMIKAVVKQVRTGHRPLSQAAAESPVIAAVLTRPEIVSALNPENTLGSSDIFIDRALAGYEADSAVIRPDPGSAEDLPGLLPGSIR
ncbi:MAG: 3-carboxy-cis,cis-muconate cycloisomerase [Deltaproteobacteria bacterium]|nr:3-carboxy-cis,cis-muconate cycloisomerase [Deltaproteobacteria bacterium]